LCHLVARECLEGIYESLRILKPRLFAFSIPRYSRDYAQEHREACQSKKHEAAGFHDTIMPNRAGKSATGGYTYAPRCNEPSSSDNIFSGLSTSTTMRVYSESFKSNTRALPRKWVFQNSFRPRP